MKPWFAQRLKKWIFPALLFLTLQILSTTNTSSAYAAEPSLTDLLADLGFTNITEVTDETFPAGSYEIHLLAEFAGNHASNTVSHYPVGTSDFQVLITGPAGNFGKTNPQISLLLVQENDFGLSFEDANRFFTETSRNPDGIKHTRVFKDNNDPGTFLIGFEDIFGGGDLDFNDMVFRLNPSEGPTAPLQGLSPLQMTARIYIDEKDTPGLANTNRKLIVSIVLDNPGNTDKTLVVCPMLHVHDPAEPKLNGQVLSITANGGQRVATETNRDFDGDGVLDGPGVYRHARTIRFPFPHPTPFTVRANSGVVINYPAKLSDFIPPLDNFTRAEIRNKTLKHASNPVFGHSTLYIDTFFNFNLDPGDVFQCPNGFNTWWDYGQDDPGDFDFPTFHWYDFTFTNMFSTVTIPLTLHTSETAGTLIDGRTPFLAFIEVIPNCSLVECPSTPGTSGTSGLPTVVWTTDPAPGNVFVIDELEQVGLMTIETPGELPEGAVMQFEVIMKDAESGRVLSNETKRFAQDVTPPLITSFDFMEDDMFNLMASALVQDQAASIEFVELLVSRDGGLSFAGFPMEQKEGDFLNPTRFEITHPLGAGKSIFKIRAVDEAGNAAETTTHISDVPLGIAKCYFGKQIPPFTDNNPQLPFPTIARVTLNDQFASRETDVRFLKGLCNPAGKNEDVDPNRMDHLSCYSISDAPGQPLFFSGLIGEIQIETENFGEDTVKLGHALELCVSASKNGQFADIGDFKCYSARSAQRDFPEITLDDQFFANKPATIERLSRFCTPVGKDQPAPPENPEAFDHLACYDIGRDRLQPQTNVSLTDQFIEAAVQDITFTAEFERRFCEPARKISVKQRGDMP